MQKITRIISGFALILSFLLPMSFLLSPSMALAQTPPKTFTGGIVQCGNGVNGGLVSDPGSAGSGAVVGQQSCGFVQLMQLINRIIDYLLFLIAPIIATCIILYAGILMLTSAGSTENVTKAKGLFSKAVIGLLVALMAWLIVKFLMTSLGYDTSIYPRFY